ncbi:MAG: PilZ domain-containing protein [Solidesulfovibrio sp.]
MYDSIRRLLSHFLFRQNQPDPQATRLLGVAVEQQALFQMMTGEAKATLPFRYMVCRGIHGNGVVLSSRNTKLLFRNYWEKKEFSFRFLIQTEADKFPKLYKFQGKITKIHQDMKTITVAIPDNIAVLEQRRNVRLKLHRHHLPGFSVWYLPRSRAETLPQLLKQRRCIMDLTDQVDEVQSILKNISAGGMRLSLPLPVFAQHEQRLAKGSLHLVQFTFPGQETEQEHTFMFIAKVSNTLVADDPNARPEIGMQFVSARIFDPHAHWRDVRSEGSQELFTLLQSYHLEYYRNLKKNLIMREALLPNPTARSRPGAERMEA